MNMVSEVMALNNGRKPESPVELFFFFCHAIQHVGSFLTRDGTHALCIESVES